MKRCNYQVVGIMIFPIKHLMIKYGSAIRMALMGKGIDRIILIQVLYPIVWYHQNGAGASCVSRASCYNLQKSSISTVKIAQ